MFKTRQERPYEKNQPAEGKRKEFYPVLTEFYPAEQPGDLQSGQT